MIKFSAKPTFDFTVIILSILVGAFTGALSTIPYGTKAIWIASTVLVGALLFLHVNPKTLLRKAK